MQTARWVRRVGIGVILLALVAAVSVYFFQRQFGEFLFERGLSQNIGRDLGAELPDGLNVYVCGTGTPVADPDRAGPCIAVLAGGEAFIFDAGSGSMRVLGRMGFPLNRIERVFLTHVHSDHFDGFGEMMVQAWVGGSRSEPLPVWGPTGTRETMEGLNAAYRVDSTYRIAHHGTQVANPVGYGFAPREIQLPDGVNRVVVYRSPHLTITAFRVTHGPVRDPLGYRIDYKGRSIAISGDTVYDPNLVAAANGVDILFHEALDPEMVEIMQRAAEARDADNIARVLFDIRDYHGSPEDAARAASDAEARSLVLYHMIPPIPSSLLHAFFLGDTADLFDGDIRLAEDGMLISLPAGSNAIRYSNAVR